jgi:hypothetical protein
MAAGLSMSEWILVIGWKSNNDMVIVRDHGYLPEDNC